LARIHDSLPTVCDAEYRTRRVGASVSGADYE
jgi:hypothetical protein